MQKKNMFNIFVRALLDKGASQTDICNKININKQYFSTILHHKGNITDKMFDNIVNEYGFEMPVLISGSEYNKLKDSSTTAGSESAANDAMVQNLINRIEKLSAENGLLKFKLDNLNNK